MRAPVLLFLWLLILIQILVFLFLFLFLDTPLADSSIELGEKSRPHFFSRSHTVSVCPEPCFAEKSVGRSLPGRA